MIISRCACGATQELSTSEQELTQLTDALHCGQQNAGCRHTDEHRVCREQMRTCIAAMHHSPDLDALQACNAAYGACAGDDDGGLADGGTGAGCDAEHRACLCTVFTDARNDFCANVALRCLNDTSRLCTADSGVSLR